MPKVHYNSKFNKAWIKDFEWLRAVPGDVNSAFCSLCKCQLSVSHGGKNDIQKHLKTTKHIQAEGAIRKSKKITQMFPTGQTELDKVRITLIKGLCSFDSQSSSTWFYQRTLDSCVPQICSKVNRCQNSIS